ncbi:hypothetical protein niasHS_010720 [Heterodera schachtii]|uniref:Uncharacterized protein n=2 Tax=Heterodera TaxID=34509 RepID=A0ABD2ITK0_HETSC
MAFFPIPFHLALCVVVASVLLILTQCCGCCKKKAAPAYPVAVAPIPIPTPPSAPRQPPVAANDPNYATLANLDKNMFLNKAL